MGKENKERELQDLLKHQSAHSDHQINLACHQEALQIFTFLNSRGKIIFCDNWKFKLLRPCLKFYWNTATLIGLHVAYVCFRSTTAELHKGSREGMTFKAENIYRLSLNRETFLTTDLRL